jgi:hypothetical protein
MAAPEICPNCGAEVPPEAKACSECGACEETGWSAHAAASGLGLPDDKFDYEDFVDNEFGGGKRRHGTTWFWFVIGVLLVAIILIMIFWWK